MHVSIEATWRTKLCSTRCCTRPGPRDHDATRYVACCAAHRSSQNHARHHTHTTLLCGNACFSFPSACRSALLCSSSAALQLFPTCCARLEPHAHAAQVTAAARWLQAAGCMSDSQTVILQSAAQQTHERPAHAMMHALPERMPRLDNKVRWNMLCLSISWHAVIPHNKHSHDMQTLLTSAQIEQVRDHALLVRSCYARQLATPLDHMTCWLRS